MAKAPPSYQFYPSDFEMGTAHLTNEEVGAYVRLLNYQWAMDGLPSDPAVLASLARESPQKFAKIWKSIKDKFPEREGGKLANKRLEEIRETSRKRAKNGKSKSAAKLADAVDQIVD